MTSERKTPWTPGDWTVKPGGQIAAGGLVIGEAFYLGGTEQRDRNAAVMAAGPAMVELIQLFERSIVYEISKDKKSGDDEGARMKTITLNMVRALLARIGAPT